jgi:hypothetical protein
LVDPQTFDPHCALSEDMRVEPGGAHVSMAQQFLKRVATRRLQNAGAAYRRLQRALHYFLVHVVANRTAE